MRDNNEITKPGKLTMPNRQDTTQRVDQYEEIDRLRGWLSMIKDHTLDGSVLALIDLALDGKEPLPRDYERDNAHDHDEVQGMWWDTAKIETRFGI